MPRLGRYARSSNGAPGQWAGNQSLWHSIDADDQASRSNDLREQQLQFREEHAQQIEALSQRAADLHDRQITAKLADEKLLQDQQSQALDQYTKMTGEMASGALDPRSENYQIAKTTLMNRYPLAASRIDGDKNLGASNVLANYDKANEVWMESQSKLLDHGLQLAKALGVPLQRNPDGTPDQAAMQEAARSVRAGVQIDPSLAMKTQTVKDPITGETTTYAAPAAPKGTALADNPAEQTLQLHQRINKELIDKHGITASQLLNPIGTARGKLDTNQEFTNAYPEAATGDYRQIDTGGFKTVMPEKDYQQYAAGLRPAAAPTAGTPSTSPPPIDHDKAAIAARIFATQSPP